MTYRLADEQVCQFYLSLRSLAEARLAEVGEITRRFLEARQGLQPVDREQLLAKVRDGAVTVLDVRPPEEYAAGHLPGALSVPLKELERRLAELRTTVRLWLTAAVLIACLPWTRWRC